MKGRKRREEKKGRWKEGGKSERKVYEYRRRGVGGMEAGQGESRIRDDRKGKVDGDKKRKKVLSLQVQSPRLKQSKAWESPTQRFSTVNPNP